MVVRFFLLSLVIFSCAPRYGSDPILVPELSQDYYRSSVRSLEEQLQERPGDLNIMRLQLDHYEKLGWPEKAEKAVKRAQSKQKWRDDPILLNQFLDFYMTNEKFDELFALIAAHEDQAILSRSLQRSKIQAMVTMGERVMDARYELSKFIENVESGDHFFAGSMYLQLGDSILSAFHFLKSYDLGERIEELAVEATPVWHNLELHDPVVDLLDKRSQLESDKILILASSLYATGDSVRAKKILWSGTFYESRLVLSRWYQEEQKWDSAHLALDKENPLPDKQIEILMLHGDIDQSRGWLTSSLTHYDQILLLDSTNQEAQEQIEIVHRKIAYLRRIREMQREIPTLNLSSKKIGN